MRRDEELIVRREESQLAGAIRLIGGGGHASVVAEALQLARVSIDGFFDDDVIASVPGCERLGTFLDAFSDQSVIPHILAIGDLNLRERLARAFNGRLTTVVHPSAAVARWVRLGAGGFVGAGAVINCRAQIDRHAIVNTRAVIEHDCIVASNVHVGPGAVLGGGVRVGASSLIGINASVRPNIVIGSHCTIGAGAAVVRDVADDEVVVGVPARPIHRSTIRHKVA